LWAYPAHSHSRSPETHNPCWHHSCSIMTGYTLEIGHALNNPVCRHNVPDSNFRHCCFRVLHDPRRRRLSLAGSGPSFRIVTSGLFHPPGPSASTCLCAGSAPGPSRFKFFLRPSANVWIPARSRRSSERTFGDRAATGAHRSRALKRETSACPTSRGRSGLCLRGFDHGPSASRT